MSKVIVYLSHVINPITSTSVILDKRLKMNNSFYLAPGLLLRCYSASIGLETTLNSSLRRRGNHFHFSLAAVYLSMLSQWPRWPTAMKQSWSIHFRLPVLCFLLCSFVMLLFLNEGRWGPYYLCRTRLYDASVIASAEHCSDPCTLKTACRPRPPGYPPMPSWDDKASISVYKKKKLTWTDVDVGGRRIETALSEGLQNRLEDAFVHRLQLVVS